MQTGTASVLLQHVARLLVLSVLVSETAFAGGAMQATAPASRESGTAGTSNVVPAGTVVPLTLISPVNRKSTKPGDEVRAKVAFPVSVGSHVVIPQGSYVNGTLVSATPATRKMPAALKVHFTELIFPSGYMVALDAVNTARLDAGVRPVRELAANASPAYYPFGRGAHFYGPDPGFGQVTFPTQTTTQPTLSDPGPSKGLIIGLMVGTAAAMIALSAIFLHHRNAQIGSLDTVLFDAGWQFQMKLDKALTVDMAKMTTTTASPSAGF